MHQEVLATRGPKYRAFLAGMDVATRVAQRTYTNGKERVEFLKIYYALMRYIDDIIDGDRPLPEGYGSIVAFTEDLLTFVRQPVNAEEERVNVVQRLLLYCLRLGARFDQDFHVETEYILSSMLFDAKRRTDASPTFHSEESLQRYFHDLDIRGTIRACLKVGDESTELEEDIVPLGRATRIQYNLRDLDEDVAAGLVNVSAEDAKRLGLTMDDLQQGTNSSGVRAWCTEQAALAWTQLEQHGKAAKPKRWMTNAVLSWVYERPARNFIRQTLHDTAGIQLYSMRRAALSHPMRYLLAKTHAERLSRANALELEINDEEKPRFAKKAGNLAMLYSDLTESRDPISPIRAARAGFLSAAYDVATDWRKFDATSYESFDTLLVRYSPRERDLAIDLYEKDRRNALADDGLERGAVSLEFIASVMNIRTELERRGIPIVSVGQELQLVDDILDYEEDVATGDTNCLTTPRAPEHLQRIRTTNMPDFFHPMTLLRQTIERSRIKAILLQKEMVPVS